MSDKNIFTEMEGRLKDDPSFRPVGADYYNPTEFKNLIDLFQSQSVSIL